MNEFRIERITTNDLNAWILIGGEMSKVSKLSRKGPLMISATLVLGIPASALAQTAELAEIVVTAEKRPETIQTAPSAIVAVSGQALENASVTDITELDKLIPGLSVYNISNSPNVSLRGVGQVSVTDNSNPAVGYYVDGVYVPRAASEAAFFDISQLEVLAGPQGTLYGRNAIGGVIDVATGAPSSQYEGSVRLEGGNYGLFHGTSVVNLPVDDKLKLRLAVDYNRHDGYFSNGTDDLDSIAGRLTVLYQPTDDLTLTLYASDAHNGGLGEGLIAKPGASPALSPAQAAVFNTNASDPFKTSFPTTGFGNDANATLVSWHTDYQWNNVDFTNIAGYTHYNDSLDNQFGLGTFQTSFVGNSYSDELRVSNDKSERNTWLAGLYYYQSSGLQQELITVPGEAFVPPLPVGRTSPTTLLTHQNGYAAFGEYRYTLLDWLHVTVGGRASYDKETGGGASVLPLSSATPATAFGGGIDAWRGDGKAVLEAQLAPQSLVYAGVQTGYLPGGYSVAPLNSPPGVSHTFDPEHLIAYTLGTKNTFFDNRLRLNDELFYYDYRNYQQSQPVALIEGGRPVFILVTYNAEKVRIYGTQLDAEYLVTPDDDLTLSVTAMSPTFRHFTIPTVGVFDGYQLPYASTATLNAGYKHSFALPNGASLEPGVNVNYNDGYWGTYSHAPQTHQGAFTRTDVSVTYLPADPSWSVTAYVHGLENKRIYAAMNNSPQPTYQVVAGLYPPLTYGVSVQKRF